MVSKFVEVSEEEKRARRIVGFTQESIINASSTEYPGVYPGEDHSWNTEKFKKDFEIKFHETSDDGFDSSFSLIGINAAIANALRRILIAEVPTLAIETIYFINNTSVIQDEVLAQRLGLIPLKGDKLGLEWMKWFKKPVEGLPGSSSTDYNTVVLTLKVQCEWKSNGKELWKQGERDPRNLYENAQVYAKQMKFKDEGRQAELFKHGPIEAVNPDILIAKLRPGQEIDLIMHCHKGIGADHAKFSPVATASYRLLPTITITEPIIGADAKKFARCFPRGVIKLETVTKAQADKTGSGYEGHEGDFYAVVDDPMKDTVSRECLRHPEFKDKVKLGRIQDHFIFKVESTGQIESNQLFIEAVKVLRYKCDRAKKHLADM